MEEVVMRRSLMVAGLVALACATLALPAQAQSRFSGHGSFDRGGRFEGRGFERGGRFEGRRFFGDRDRFFGRSSFGFYGGYPYYPYYSPYYPAYYPYYSYYPYYGYPYAAPGPVVVYP
jgi:hypothetical protein